MKTVQWILIGSRIFALTCGLTVLCGGCGDNSAGAGGPSQKELKRNEDIKKAMEEVKAKAKKASPRSFGRR
jgi:hypothetical protein